MPDHTPTIARGLITCDACAFRAVLANDGRAIVTSDGDASADHLALVRAQQAERDQQAARVMDRLRDHYATGRAIAWELFLIGQREGSGATTEDFVLKHGSTGALSLNQLQRLYRAVLGEFAL